MEYKNTLNLPQTDFPMKADLVTREPQRLAKWESMALYQKIQALRANAEKFVLHDGPPFANGDVHIGTALNKILKDIIVKYHSLRGKSAPYIPGWDCHGLPIEFKVTQEMRKAGDTTADAATIRKACDAYARKYIDLQRVQFKRLGVLGDWDNPYLTLNKKYEADELRLFADIVEKGFVYRGKKPVYWSIPARTALAEAEVEYHEHVSQSIYVKFPVIGQPDTFVVIWTTTPWTLPANLAVAYNSTFQYVQVTVGAEKYILSRGLLPAVAEKCGWTNYQETSFDAAELAKLQYQHPFCNRTGKLYAGDSFVTNDTGTGFVHIAPGHGQDDYNLGRFVGLPIYSPVDDDGAFAYTNELPREQQMPAEMIGKSILEKHGKSDANEIVLHELRLRKVLLHQENYHHSYPYCWRSKTPIIFRAMDQWFIRIDTPGERPPRIPNQAITTLRASFDASTTEGRQALATSLNRDEQYTGLRRLAINAIEDIRWIPNWGKSRIQAAVISRPDWCISRQRSWGVPIPAFYGAKGLTMLYPVMIRKFADLVEKYGSNIWFEKNVEELAELLEMDKHTPEKPVSKFNDTLDVWIDSGSSSRAVLMRRPELLHFALPTPNSKLPTPKSAPDWQADIYLEGSDQHRGWFQSSLLLSLAGNGVPPFKTVLTHGFMVDADREKISKSKQGQGVYEKPQTSEAYIKKYGADVVRLWVASQDYRNDIVVSDERINKVSETYRAIRNTLRYQLSNLFDFDPAKHAVSDDKLTGLDRWILAEFSKLENEVITAYDNYEFHVVYQKISQFVAVELSAIYHDVVKDRLYTDAANSHRRRSTQTALHRLVIGLCKMLSPILVFTADEAWEFVPQTNKDSVHVENWEKTAFILSAAEKGSWQTLFELRDRSLIALEEARKEKKIGKALESKLKLAGPWAEDLNQKGLLHDVFRELVNVSFTEFWKIEGNTTNIVLVEKADGQKCERCWHWETDVGSNPEHPTICARCVAAVKENLSAKT